MTGSGRPAGSSRGSEAGSAAYASTRLRPSIESPERRDVVVVEDAGRDERPQRLAAPVGQEGDLARQVGRQLVERPAELVQPAGDPVEPPLMLALDLLGDDPVLPRGADVVEVGLHQRLGGDARRGGGQGQAQVLHVEPRPEPERTHEHGLSHAMDLPQGRPVGVGRDGPVQVDLRVEDLVNHAIDAPHGEPQDAARAGDQVERQQGDPAAREVVLVDQERVERAGRRRQLVQGEAAEGATDVLLAVEPHQLRDLRPEAGADLGVALGVVGEEVDRRELDRLEERLGLPAAAPGRLDRLGPAATLSGHPIAVPAAARRRGRDGHGPGRRQRIRQPDLLRGDLQPAGEPGPELATDRLGRHTNRSLGIACRL